MSFFFPRAAYHTEASFTPLFRILDDIEKVSRPSYRGGCHPGQYRAAYPARRQQIWAPRFDIRETDDAYVLNGELPGLSRDQVSVEFPEPRTLVVRGDFENTTTTGDAPQQDKVAAAAAAAVADDAASATDVASVSEETSSRKSYQATVEDDGDNFEVIDNPTAEKQQLLSEQQLQQESAAAAAPVEKKPEPEQPAELNHFWLKERRAGNFSRTFRFASYVDHDGVTASLKDGVLSVVVPKAPKPETHRISVN